MESLNAPNIHPGTTIGGKYTIASRIGSGGMGVVYEAEHTAISRRVAIKLLRPEYSDDPKAVSRFEQEARAAGAIDHSGICEVIDFGMTDKGRPFMVMPLLHGESLANVVKKERLEISRVIDIISQVLEALEAAHRARIVHRDLKPDNIFLTRMGDRADFVKILDFGISKIMNQDKIVELTRTGSVMGTPQYMAPEQARGAKHLDHRVDIYAVGVILYQLLTGKRPFDGDNYNEVIIKLATEQFKPPRAIAPEIDPALEAVTLKALARDCAQRFSSATEMRAALLEKSPLPRVEPTAGQANIETVTADSMAGLTLPTGFDTGPSTLSSAVREESVPSTPTRKSKKSRWIGSIAVGALGLLIALSLGRGFSLPVHDDVEPGLGNASAVAQAAEGLAHRLLTPDKKQTQRFFEIARKATERISAVPSTAAKKPVLSMEPATKGSEKKPIKKKRPRSDLASKRASLKAKRARAKAAAKKTTSKGADEKVGYGRFGTMIFSDYGD